MCRIYRFDREATHYVLQTEVVWCVHEDQSIGRCDRFGRSNFVKCEGLFTLAYVSA